MNEKKEPIDEYGVINIIDLIKNLWASKVTILTCVLITLSIAVAYILLSTKIYETRIVLSPPTHQQIKSLNEVRLALSLDLLYPADALANLNSRLNSRSLLNDFTSRHNISIFSTELDSSRILLRLRTPDPNSSIDLALKYLEKASELTTTEMQDHIDAMLKVRISLLQKKISILTNISSDANNQEYISAKIVELTTKMAIYKNIVNLEDRTSALANITEKKIEDTPVKPRVRIAIFLAIVAGVALGAAIVLGRQLSTNNE